MKFSEAWLREFVNPDIGVDALAAKLAMAGLEVDSVEPVAGAFIGVVVGEVVGVAAHPDAEKLSVCTVSDGADEFQVVCGAPNVRVGMKSPFARVGARLPGDFEIKKAKLRGVESFGMLCSAAELEIGDDADGILDLDGTVVVGADLIEALALDDRSIDLELTPNRGDCLSLKGVAREVGVLTDLAIKVPDCEPVPATHGGVFPVRLDDAAGCPRYLGRVIRDVDVTRPTPLWMTEKLRRSGLRSIDAVVDVTNYVLLELGQPMHAFDLAVLDTEIVVRRAAAGEKLELLDGSQVALDERTLLITDAGGPVAMAGVMGGARSGISAATQDVFLECAFFAPLAVAGTARRYGMQTDASHRYERGVDTALQHVAIERATQLLLEVVGGEPGPVTEAVSDADLPAPRSVRLRAARLEHLVGMPFASTEVERVLTRLGLHLVGRDETEAGPVWTFGVPSHRFDIEIEEDLVEEVCRIIGYNEIPVAAPVTDLDLRRVPIEKTPKIRVQTLLADLGYQEAVTYSFIDPGLADLLDPGTVSVAITNPMSQDQSVMRTNLLPGLLKTLAGNIARQQERVRLFELGQCFEPGVTPTQAWKLGAVLWGSRLPENWSQAIETVDFFDAKGDVERILGLSGSSSGALERDLRFEATEDPVLHPGQAARILVGDRQIGRVGRIHPEIENTLDLKGAAYIFELDGGTVLGRVQPRYREVSRYPSVRRDLSLAVANHVTAADVEATVRATLGDSVVEFRLFDLYHGESIDSNEKSVAVGLTFQDPSRTLTDLEISGLVETAVTALEDALGVRRR
jgi:phenylalanyl-tRNA synthetase beta chain